LTSKEKLAKILAMRMMRDILHQHIGIIDFHEMIKLVNSQSLMDLSNGEAEVLIALKAVLSRKDDSRLEGDMKAADEFKELLKAQFDSLIHHLKLELAG
jgi:hypothetical protein